MNKKALYKIALFILSVCAFSAVLVLVYVQAEKVKTKRLSAEVQRVLRQSGNVSSVAGPVLLKTPAQTSSLVFSLVNKNGQKAGYACLVRITGACGPVPAVFVCDEQKNISFAGIAGLPDIFSKELYGLTDMQLFYWTLRITRFMEAAGK